MEYKYYILTLNILATTVNCETIKCLTSLTCQNSLCCKDGECVDNKECVKDTHIAYIACGVVGGLFILGTLIYFLKTIKDCRSQVKEMMEKLEKAN